jgi:23S rRNA (guanosine2251-2'-O)-methyltransferase|tara:strand:- start:136 stop:675 length:540 start_codon:yes stop_codon:yes gene_type:complete
MNKKLKLEELDRLSIEDFKKSIKDPIIVLLDNVRSLHNIGSVFRTCDAMGVSKIYLCGITAQPPHREIRKTAIGATESVDWEYAETPLEVINKYKKLKYSLIAVEQTSESILLNNFDYKMGKTLLIFGNEIDGVSQNLIDKCDLSLEVPQWGTKHSMNISVTTGIVVWTLKMKKQYKQQ